MINRDEYVKKIVNSMWDGNVKVITGLRRSGKSTLLFELFYNYLMLMGVLPENIIKIELDKISYLKYRNPILLNEFVTNTIQNKVEKYYLFIDEVQLSKKTVLKNEYDENEISIYDMLNELKGYKNLDVYVTGSNSKMLSSDIATEFRGRSTQIHVFPLSFSEYYSYYGGNEKEALDDYMLFGGMPGLINKKTPVDKMEYLDDLFKETYLKDLKEHGRIQREDILANILDYLSSSISSLTNSKNVSNVLSNSMHENIDSNLVNSYIEKLKDSFLISEVKRFDIKGKTYFTYPNKYYFTDLGLRNSRLNYRQFDYGHIMENIIYNELIKRGYKVDVGVVYDRRNGNNISKEIDFIVNDFDKKIYIQSSYEINNDEKLNSELDSLLLTKDFYKKVIIRTDIKYSFYDDKGFFHCNIIDFLLNRINLF